MGFRCDTGADGADLIDTIAKAIIDIDKQFSGLQIAAICSDPHRVDSHGLGHRCRNEEELPWLDHAGGDLGMSRPNDFGAGDEGRANSGRMPDKG